MYAKLDCKANSCDLIDNTNSVYSNSSSSKNNITYGSVEELAAKEETRKAAVKSMVAKGKEEKLTALELRMKDCVLITKVEWSPGNGMTATMKIDRKKIFSMHIDELNAMLKRNGAPPHE